MRFRHLPEAAVRAADQKANKLLFIYFPPIKFLRI